MAFLQKLFWNQCLKMPAFMDIDKFIKRNDLRSEFEWPWTWTHFIISERCIVCGFHSSSGSLPRHFVCHKSYVKLLLHFNWFWCTGCLDSAIYDHYPTDECQYCS